MGTEPYFQVDTNRRVATQPGAERNFYDAATLNM